MYKNLKAVKLIAKVNKTEEELLKGIQKPILTLKKIKGGFSLMVQLLCTRIDCFLRF